MAGTKSGRAHCLGDLAHALRRYTDSCATTNPYPTAIDGLVILRSDQPKLPTFRLFRPALCIAVQGTKWATFGDRRYEYNHGAGSITSSATGGMEVVQVDFILHQLLRHFRSAKTVFVCV